MNVPLSRFLLAAALTLLPALGESQETVPKDQSIAVTEDAGAFIVTVPVSRLALTIPKGDLKESHEGAAGGPRYFHLQAEHSGLIVTGWFEPDHGYRGIEELWSGEVAAWKRHGDPEPKDVSFERLGSWDAVVYDVAVGPMRNSHIRASRVQAGTWIDLHLSLTMERPPAELRQSLRDELASIRVAEKQ